ncbi:M23 family metallopeptidase [Tomitella biformata]|uniref:M23 family metallopeptidase n=1 Tax=Tomitella biformata TaxID=630403 RepID=UPI000466DA03|nr:M23 family metallopeptidase [Tomitella biformata]
MRLFHRAASLALAACCAVAAALPLSAAPGGVPATRGDYVWPLAPRPAVARPFEPPPFKYGRGHRGVDLAGVPGQTVLAAGPGVVAFAGQVAGRPVVSIDHSDGLRTTYEPVASGLPAGEIVVAGAPIGALEAGHLGCGQAACLHWGLRRGEDYLNPLTLVGAVAIRLKPVDAPDRAPPAAAPR